MSKLEIIQRCADEELEQKAAVDLPHAVALIEEALRGVLRSPEACDRLNYARHGDHPFSLSIELDHVSMEPSIFHQKTLRGVIERPGWSVTVWQYVPGNRYEPPSTDAATVDVFPTWVQAARKLLSTWMEEKLAGFFDSKADERYAEQMANEPTHLEDYP